MSEDAPRTAEDMPLPGGDWTMFVTRLSIQGLLACGVLENPVSGRKHKNLPGARMILDDLLMLKEKVAGNVEGDEAAHLNKVIADLTQVIDTVGGA